MAPTNGDTEADNGPHMGYAPNCSGTPSLASNPRGAASIHSTTTNVLTSKQRNESLNVRMANRD